MSDAPPPESQPEIHHATDLPHVTTGPVAGRGYGLVVCAFVLSLAVGFFGQQWLRKPAVLVHDDGLRYRVALRGDEPQLGPSDALVTIIEFADYECPHCARAAAPLTETARAFRDDVRILYKHYPLPHHRRAGPAARAAWAAQQQGVFWQAHERLFETGGAVNELVIEADRIGLDPRRLERDMVSEAAREAVDDDFLAGARLGVTGTPTFFVNGHRYVGGRTTREWEQIIAAEHQAAAALLRNAVPRARVYERLMATAEERG